MNPMISSDLDLPNGDMEPELDDEKQQTATITTDEVQPIEDDKPLATDDAAIKARFLPPLPDLEILDEQKQVYVIESWKSLERKDHGPTFTAGGAPWRVLMFPFGNNNNTDACSLYLEHNFEEKPPEDWYCCVEFLFVLSNTNDPSIYVTNSAHHRFNADATDWGFTRFVDLRKMAMPWEGSQRPLLENDGVTITTHIRVVKDPTGVLWHNFENYDSKKETGMVGLKNQGATCYLNSLLQSLYLTNAFRKAIYQIPTEDEISPRDNSAYALQRLFYYLQKSNEAVGTGELTGSFGWDTRQIFEQQDVQELSRILMDRMESRMKGTSSEKALEDLFVGSTKTFLECLNVDYESSRSQVFWDIQLNVKGNRNLDESFKDCIQEETMNGENQYFAEGFGLQDAKKGEIFERFPAVLHLQLKRFEYNWETESTTKINDLFEFPETFDASPYLAKNADFSEPWTYKLHGVLVHSGDLNAGHYYAFLKPKKDGGFYKFDDDRVTPATLKEAIDENFGGEFAAQPNGVNGVQRNPFTFKYTKSRFMSAYMLVYIRESRLDQVLHPIGDEDVPAHLDRKITEEHLELERRRKEKEDAHLYTSVSVGTNENFNAYQGFDVFANPNMVSCPPNALPRLYKLLKTTLVSDLIALVAEELGAGPEMLRPWACVGRQNHTIRPDQPIQHINLSLEECNTKLGTKAPLRIWMEVAERKKPNGEPDWPEIEAVSNVKNPSQPILLFLKYFDIDKQSLYGQGTVYIEKSKRISELGPLILQRMGWSAGTPIKLFEEIKATMIDTMKTSNTFATSELQNGDIVCFQKALTDVEITQLLAAHKIVEVPKFYDHLLNRMTISLVDRNAADAPDGQITSFDMELSRKMSYDQLAARVGERLGVDPAYLRFSTLGLTSNRPRPPLRRSTNATLGSMMNYSPGMYGANAAVRNDLLLYEVLEMSLSELDTKRSVRVVLLTDGMAKEELFDLLVPKDGVVRDLIAPLKKKAELSDDFEQNLRFYEVRSSRIYQELDESLEVGRLQDFNQIYAERLPQDEIEANVDSDIAVYAFHFDKEPAKAHGVPFKFIIKPGEVFSATKERISKRIGIKGKAFEKIKFFLVPKSAFQKPVPIEDDDIVADKIGHSDELGLDHINRTRNILSRGDAMMIK